LDTERARTWLEGYLQLAENAIAVQRIGGDYWTLPEWGKLDAELESRMHAADQIVAAINPSLRGGVRPDRDMYSIVWSKAATTCREALGILAHSDEVDEIIGPQGPVLSAVGLHPWVWDSAAKPWGDGHRRASIQAAATRVDTETQSKLERWDISGYDLGNQAWTGDDPTEGKPRLRPPGYDPQSETSRSELNGARGLHAGVMAGIRNRATHDLDEPDEQVALEQLATISLLARWIDAAEVHCA
jgi:hypothetical protein